MKGLRAIAAFAAVTIALGLAACGAVRIEKHPKLPALPQ